jgi:hypothetical protein
MSAMDEPGTQGSEAAPATCMVTILVRTQAYTRQPRQMGRRKIKNFFAK